MMVPRSIDDFLEQRSIDNFIECSHSRAAAFREENGVDESTDAVKFKHKAWKILTKAKQVLDKLNIPFWLSSGTCLGMLFYSYLNNIGFFYRVRIKKLIFLV